MLKRAGPFAILLAVLLPWAVPAPSGQEPPATPQQKIEGARARETFERVCVRCHTAERVTAQPRTRGDWEEVIIAMRTTRGAVFTDEEFATVLDYLAREHAPPPVTEKAAAPPQRGGRATPPGPRPFVGAADRHRVDDAAAARGLKIYAAECVTCHGPAARGTERGANLVRSALMLRDRYGSAIGPLLKKGHPMQTAASSAALTDAQIADLSHFIWQRINDTLRGSPVFDVKNVLVGDRQAGEAYFHGEGGCASCHSPTGDLAGYGRTHRAVDIQQRFVFPAANAGRGDGGAPRATPVMVTVMAPGAAPVTGRLLSLDDFHVALRDAAGEYRSWTRTRDMTITKDDPYAAHVALLDRLTDKAMHDVTAYLESLK